MKRILAVALLTLATLPAMAHGWVHGGYRYHGGYYGGGWGWVAPAIIGGAVVYSATRPDPVIVQQQPVIVQNPPTVVYQPRENCGPWTETQQSDGTITRTRTCSQ